MKKYIVVIVCSAVVAYIVASNLDKRQRVKERIAVVAERLESIYDSLGESLDRHSESIDRLEAKIIELESLSSERYTADIYDKVETTFLNCRDLYKPAEMSRSAYINKMKQVISDELELKGFKSWSECIEYNTSFYDELRFFLEKDPYNPEKLDYFEFIQTAENFFYAGKSMSLLMNQRQFLESNDILKALIAFSKRLQADGIDFIYVPVPSSVEVYPEFASSKLCATDIIAPGNKKLFYDLLANDVEVLELLPAFRSAKMQNMPRNQLYIPFDTHWSNGIIQVTAKLLGERLQRYDFIKSTMSKPKIYQKKWARNVKIGKAYSRLPDEIKQSKKKFPLDSLQVIESDGELYREHKDAPVLIIGDSFAYYFSTNFDKSAGITEHLAYVINQPVSNYSTGGLYLTELSRNASELFDPNVRKLVIYVQNSAQLAGGTWTPLEW